MLIFKRLFVVISLILFSVLISGCLATQIKKSQVEKKTNFISSIAGGSLINNSSPVLDRRAGAAYIGFGGPIIDAGTPGDKRSHALGYVEQDNILNKLSESTNTESTNTESTNILQPTDAEKEDSKKSGNDLIYPPVDLLAN